MPEDKQVIWIEWGRQIIWSQHHQTFLWVENPNRRDYDKGYEEFVFPEDEAAWRRGQSQRQLLEAQTLKRRARWLCQQARTARSACGLAISRGAKGRCLGAAARRRLMSGARQVAARLMNEAADCTRRAFHIGRQGRTNAHIANQIGLFGRKLPDCPLRKARLIVNQMAARCAVNKAMERNLIYGPMIERQAAGHRNRGW